MIYLYWYLGIGASVLALLYGKHLQAKQEESELLRVFLDAANPDRKKLSYRILSNIVVPAITAVAVVLFWPVAGYMTVKDFFSKKNEHVIEEERGFVVGHDQLQERLSVQEIEAREMVHDPLCAVPNLPFGHLNAVWCRYLEGLADGDELWSFTARWQHKWGKQEHREGYVLIQNGNPGDHILTVWEDPEEQWDFDR